MKEFSFPKSQRLKSTTTFQALFSKGASFNKYPVRVVYLSPEQAKTVLDEDNSESPPTSATVRFGFTVPKKKFKSAVDRNRIKRQLKEACRLRKNAFVQGLNDISAFGDWTILFIYVAKEKMHFNKIDKGVATIFKKMLTSLQTSED